MSRKSLIWISMLLGSTIGGFVPILWGGDALSFSSILLSGIGGILGIWFGFKFGE
ncbi:MAG: hypothetical protein HZB99_00445 [Candidatus Harrisonbacteria bacterium]|nr:hypothetical protein [Candidatus Harrisonbacteria bacterium]